MMRLRIFMGLTTALHGLGGLLFEYDSGVSSLVRTSEQHGWHWSAALIFSGLLMAWAAGREWGGEQRRRCREIAAFVLAVTWLAVFFNTFMQGASTLTLVAPLYVWFCFWAWLGEAAAHRNRLAKEGGE